MSPNMDRVAESEAHKAATRFGVDMDAIFKPWPRSPLEEAARTFLIGKLRGMVLDLPSSRNPSRKRYRYTIAQLMEWFSVSRPTIARSATRAGGYKPRRRLQEGASAAE